MSPKRIAVIGAGASGLPAIKWCKEKGLEVVCFERTDHIGGLWYYTPHSVENQACVMKSTVINTSKEKMCYSDYPIPKEFANYMHNTKVLEYFQLYAEHFKLKEAIRFMTEVLEVKKASDFNQMGKWDLRLKDLRTSDITKETFDGVLLCTGHHAEKHVPVFPGMECFKGKIVHTHDYKDHVGYENQRVVVIGIGNSGGDVTVELGKIAKQVFLSTRRGSWIMYRVTDDGLPRDMVTGTRLGTVIHQLLPFSILNGLVEKKISARFNHATYGLRPKHRIMSQHPTVNDDLPNSIICGSVIVKPDISSITETGVVFKDGTMEDNIDTIIVATGYKFGFPFIEKGVIDVVDNKVDLYKYVFPPNLEHPTLAVIGCFQPLGAIMPICELQCRLATQLWTGESKLPSKVEMWEDIRKKRLAMAERYVQSPRHTIQVDCIPFMDELAELVGCKPNLTNLFLRDPRLALECFFSGVTPYQFRLEGPNAWPGAREAIMTQWDRVYYPLKTRQTDAGSDDNSSRSLLIKLLFAFILAALVAWWVQAA